MRQAQIRRRSIIQRWWGAIQGRTPGERSIPIGVRLMSGLLLLVLIGSGLLLLPGVGATQRLTFDEALFTAVSALAVTGLSIITPSQALTPFGQLILMLLIQAGGIGFMFLAVIVLNILHRQVTLSDRLALRDSLGLAERIELWPMVRRIVWLMLAIEGAGALLLWLNWRDRLPAGQALFYAAFHAVSSFCNAGFDLFTGRPDFPAGIPRDTPTLLILGSLIVLGGLGFPVLSEIVQHGQHWRRRNTRWSLHTRVTLLAALLLSAGGAMAIFAAEIRPDGTLYGIPFERSAVLAAFQSVSTRTAGFAALPNFADATPATQITMMGLMFIGSGPASMGGGITTGTLAVLMIAVWSYARGFTDVRVAGRILPVTLVRRAASVLLVSLVIVFVAAWLILMTNAATLNEALFETISAFATTGLTLDFTSRLNGFGQIVIMALMLWGRLGVLTLIIVLARRRPSEPVGYPEENILLR